MVAAFTRLVERTDDNALFPNVTPSLSRQRSEVPARSAGSFAADAMMTSTFEFSRLTLCRGYPLTLGFGPDLGTIDAPAAFAAERFARGLIASL